MYAVIKFQPDVDEVGPFLGTTDMGLHFEDIKEAEKFRSDLLKVHKINPQNIQVIQYSMENVSSR